MKKTFVKVASIAMLALISNFAPLAAQDREAAGPVPTRSNENDPNSDVYRASDVINLPVRNDDGTEVGRIKDLVINGNSREVLYAVVAMNDAKQKDSVYIMPWNVFRPSYGQMNAIQYTVLMVPQNIWMQAPYYSMSQWRQTPFSQWGPKVNSYYSEHASVGQRNQAGSNKVQVNKPVLNDNNSKSNPEAQKKPSDKSNEKPGNQSANEKQSPEPKPSTEPKPNPSPEATKPNVPKTPAPKEPNTAEPKTSGAPPAPAPRNPK